jgi:putative membrane protein
MIALLPLAACGPTQSAVDAGRAAALAQVNPTLSTSDASFLTEAARGGLAEVKMGQLAQRNGGAASRRFGQQMITDHGRTNQQLTVLAQHKQLSLPTDIGLGHQQTYDGLAKLHGRAFDRAYAQAMVKDHETDLAAFSTEAKDATDLDVQAWAGQTLAMLERHLQMAQALPTR